MLAIFALAGPLIFEMFGITLPAFKIAGGVVLGLIGLDMLRARRSPTKEAPGDTQEGAEKEDPGITPLGVPMLAGPGAMSSVTVLMSQNADWTHRGIVLGAIATASIASFLVLRSRRAGWLLSGRNRHPYSHPHDGAVAHGGRGAVHSRRAAGRRRECGNYAVS